MKKFIMKKKFYLLSVLLLILCGLAGCSSSYQQTDGDPLAGTSWIANNDGSQWVFRDDNSFSWYRDKAVTDDYYYAGDYTVHRGSAAVDYLVEDLAEFEQTREFVENFIEQCEAVDSDYNLNNFICFSCDNKSYMLDGQEQLTEDWLTAYYGFLVDDDTTLQIVNLRTSSIYMFSREED